MEDLQIKYATIWIATVLIYLLGDVIRIFSGNFEVGEISGTPVEPEMWVLIAIIMVIPILMVILSVLLNHKLINWLNIIVAIGFLTFNLTGIAGYQIFDIILLCISFLFNVLIIYYASKHLVELHKQKKTVEESKY